MDYERDNLRWDRRVIADLLLTLWEVDGIMWLPMNVLTVRLVGALRRKFDRRGYTVTTKTQVRRNRIGIQIRMHYRGNRPPRS